MLPLTHVPTIWSYVSTGFVAVLSRGCLVTVLAQPIETMQKNNENIRVEFFMAPNNQNKGPTRRIKI